MRKTTTAPRNIDFTGTKGKAPLKDVSSEPVPLLPHQHEARMMEKVKTRETIAVENAIPRDYVKVRVPASSANMGPGFDCLGCAVDMWTEVSVERADKFEIVATGDGAAEMPKTSENYVVVGLEAAFLAANKPVPKLKYTIDSNIPYARGLGSSSAAIVSGIIAGLVLAGHQLPCWGSEVSVRKQQHERSEASGVR
jgi:homoserine kinase